MEPLWAQIMYTQNIPSSDEIQVQLDMKWRIAHGSVRLQPFSVGVKPFCRTKAELQPMISAHYGGARDTAIAIYSGRVKHEILLTTPPLRVICLAVTAPLALL